MVHAAFDLSNPIGAVFALSARVASRRFNPYFRFRAGEWRTGTAARGIVIVIDVSINRSNVGIFSPEFTFRVRVLCLCACATCLCEPEIYWFTNALEMLHRRRRFFCSPVVCLIVEHYVLLVSLYGRRRASNTYIFHGCHK